MLSDNKPITEIAMTATILITLSLLAISCKECPTEPKYEVYLSVEDVACVWVTLKVTLPDSGKINQFALERNDSTVATYTCLDDDTLIFDEGLTPDTDYSYTVCFLKDGKTKAESESITIHTLPTTSHDFIWEVNTLGNYGSYLRDAWIVDENNIWVVGNIETDSGEFNAARWNGNQWELMGIYSNTLDLYSIWYFSEDDIWVTDFGFPIHWDGNGWTLYHLQNMGMAGVSAGTAIWASSPDDIYFVGRKGSIVHYDGRIFTKLTSETTIRLMDIEGSPAGSEIWVCGYDDLEGSVLLRKQGNTFKKINEITQSTILGQPGIISHVYEDIWTCSNNYMFIASNGRVYVAHMTTTGDAGELLWWDYSTGNYPPRTTAISGSGSDNIFVAGHYSMLNHYNGETWEDIAPACSEGILWLKLAVKDNIVVAVGETDPVEGIIAIGRHQ